MKRKKTREWWCVIYTCISGRVLRSESSERAARDFAATLRRRLGGRPEVVRVREVKP